MARRIFISYQHNDQMKAKGFHLLRWNKNVDVEFVGQHLLDPVNSENKDYVWQKIKEQIDGTSVTVVLIGSDTHSSDWVRREIEHSLNKTNPNGVLAIKLVPDAPLPKNSLVGKALEAAAAEIIEWDVHNFSDAIERAAIAAGRGKKIKEDTGNDSGSCGR